MIFKKTNNKINYYNFQFIIKETHKNLNKKHKFKYTNKLKCKLNKYAKNLNELARTGKLDPVIGREEEIRRVIHILSRRTKNNPILISENSLYKNDKGIA